MSAGIVGDWRPLALRTLGALCIAAEKCADEVAELSDAELDEVLRVLRGAIEGMRS